MKLASLTIFLLFVCAGVAFAQDETGEVKRFRERRDKSFRNPSETPLIGAEFSSFKGLEYFEASEKFIVKARFEKTEDAQIFMMPTSIGTTRKYFKRGVLTFEIDGKSFSLTAFQSETASKDDSLFVPFRDLTSGKETYRAGRYLYVKASPGAEAVLDFNLAYNPNCAYGNEQFSCTLPPKENFLQIEIRAGEKVFPLAAQKK